MEQVCVAGYRLGVLSSRSHNHLYQNLIQLSILPSIFWTRYYLYIQSKKFMPSTGRLYQEQGAVVDFSILASTQWSKQALSWLLRDIQRHLKQLPCPWFNKVGSTVKMRMLMSSKEQGLWALCMAVGLYHAATLQGFHQHYPLWELHTLSEPSMNLFLNILLTFREFHVWVLLHTFCLSVPYF